MTDKEIADRLRDISNNIGSLPVVRDALTDLSDELDPPQPAPGTVVWWRHLSTPTENGVIAEWTTGVVVVDNTVGISSQYGWYAWDEIEYKPARILAPDEVAIKVPPVSKWPKDGACVEAAVTGYSDTWWFTDVITRAEAERMEAEI